MSANFKSDQHPDSDDYSIVLPCPTKDFGEFISGLLGKPQTISRQFRGPFDITKAEIENIYHLISQRLTQQNDSALVQFTARIIYDDDSSVLLNSLDDFSSYNEIKPITSIGANLSWTLLVKFQNRNTPERQQIDISFLSYGRFAVIVDEFVPITRSATNEGFIVLRIQHTARTWGADIEAMLSAHIRTLIKSPTAFRSWIHDHSASLGFAVGILLFLSALVSAFWTTHSFLLDRMNAASLVAQSSNNAGDIGKKIDFLIGLSASGIWPRHFFYLMCFLISSLIMSIGLGVWAGTSAAHEQPSFVTLSKFSENRRKVLLEINRGAWISFICSLIVSVVAGVVSNFIFACYFQRWISH